MFWWITWMKTRNKWITKLISFFSNTYTHAYTHIGTNWNKLAIWLISWRRNCIMKIICCWDFSERHFPFCWLTKGKTLILERRKHDNFVQDFNPFISVCWNHWNSKCSFTILLNEFIISWRKYSLVMMNGRYPRCWFNIEIIFIITLISSHFTKHLGSIIHKTHDQPSVDNTLFQLRSFEEHHDHTLHSNWNCLLHRDDLPLTRVDIIQSWTRNCFLSAIIRFSWQSGSFPSLNLETILFNIIHPLWMYIFFIICMISKRNL
jgi:hypothetical protein